MNSDKNVLFENLIKIVTINIFNNPMQELTNDRDHKDIPDDIPSIPLEFDNDILRVSDNFGIGKWTIAANNDQPVLLDSYSYEQFQQS